MNSSQTLEDISRSMDGLGWFVYFEDAIATNGDPPNVWIGLNVEKIVRDNSDEGDAIFFTGAVKAHVTLGYAASIDEDPPPPLEPPPPWLSPRRPSLWKVHTHLIWCHQDKYANRRTDVECIYLNNPVTELPDHGAECIHKLSKMAADLFNLSPRPYHISIRFCPIYRVGMNSSQTLEDRASVHGPSRWGGSREFIPAEASVTQK